MVNASSQSGETYEGKNIVILFDGTGNQYSKYLSNVIKIQSFLVDDKTQLTYYQPGIGTSDFPTLVGGIKGQINRTIDMMFATTLKQHVLDAYQFLMQHWEEGDKIYLFGFSRGSYTARALAGMLDRVGLLPKGNLQQLTAAYDVYSRTTLAYVAEEFKWIFCRNITIHFCGLFDSVCSVGYITPQVLPFTSRNSAIKIFRQALALDEKRVKYDYDPFFEPMEQAYHVKAADIKQVWFSGSHSDVGGGAMPDDWDQKPRASHIPLRWMLLEAHKAGLKLAKRRLLGSPIYNLAIPEIIQSYPQVPVPPNLSNKDHPRSKKSDIDPELGPTPVSSRHSWLKQYNSQVATDRIALPTPPDSIFNPDPAFLNSSIPLDVLLEEGNRNGCMADGRDVLAPIHHSLSMEFQGLMMGLLYNFLEWVPLYRLATESPEAKNGWWIHGKRARYVPPNPLFHTSVKVRMENQVDVQDKKTQLEPGQFVGAYSPCITQSYAMPSGLNYVDS